MVRSLRSASARWSIGDFVNTEVDRIMPRSRPDSLAASASGARPAAGDSLRWGGHFRQRPIAEIGPRRWLRLRPAAAAGYARLAQPPVPFPIPPSSTESTSRGRPPRWPPRRASAASRAIRDSTSRTASPRRSGSAASIATAATRRPSTAGRPTSGPGSRRLGHLGQSGPVVHAPES